MGESFRQGAPVYVQIAEELRMQIIGGSLNPGDMLPSENAICEKYGVSRDTARKSLTKLENDGLIYSKPKVGYFVSMPKHKDFTLSFLEEIPGCVTRYRDIHGIMPDQKVQEMLEISPTRKVLEFSQITKSPQGLPVAYEVKYIPYERSYPSVESELRFAVFPDITFPRVTPYAYYTELIVGVSSATEELSEILLCQEGEPLMLVERVFVHQDGSKIGYARRYIRSPYAYLKGTSGYVYKEQEETP